MSELIINFGEKSSGDICDCGRHHGCGDKSPQNRAAIVARLRERLPSHLLPPYREYLESWEEHHGAVEWREVPKIGSKGQTYMGTEYVRSVPKRAMIPYHERGDFQ